MQVDNPLTHLLNSFKKDNQTTSNLKITTQDLEDPPHQSMGNSIEGS